MSFRCLLKVIKLVSYSYHIMISNISERGQSYWEVLPVCLLFLCRFRQIFAEIIVIRRYSFKRGVCLTVQSAIYLFLVYKYIIFLCFKVIWVGVSS